MEVGIVGPPYVGKTTLFSALTGGGGGASTGSGAIRAQVGVADIPDPRLGLIASFIPTKQIIPATLRLVDAPGLAPAGSADQSTAGRVLACVRQVDALCHVVRCFDPGGRPATPGEDIDAFETELLFADLQTVESALPRAQRGARSKERAALVRLDVLEKVGAALEDSRPVRTLLAAREFDTPDEQAVFREIGFVSAKKTLYVANVGEDDIAAASSGANGSPEVESGAGDSAIGIVQARAASAGAECVALCAAIEAEIAELAQNDRAEMLEGLGIAEPALAALARALHHLLGLQSFYTAGEKEVRAWTIHVGALAPIAGGVIHSDIQRGFIRVEVYSVDDLAKHKTEKAIKEAGKMRVEGKSYSMRDGDVCHFLFNV